MRLACMPLTNYLYSCFSSFAFLTSSTIWGIILMSISSGMLHPLESPVPTQKPHLKQIQCAKVLCILIWDTEKGTRTPSPQFGHFGIPLSTMLITSLLSSGSSSLLIFHTSYTCHAYMHACNAQQSIPKL